MATQSSLSHDLTLSAATPNERTSELTLSIQLRLDLSNGLFPPGLLVVTLYDPFPS